MHHLRPRTPGVDLDGNRSSPASVMALAPEVDVGIPPLPHIETSLGFYAFIGTSI